MVVEKFSGIGPVKRHFSTTTLWLCVVSSSVTCGVFRSTVVGGGRRWRKEKNQAGQAEMSQRDRRQAATGDMVGSEGGAVAWHSFSANI